MATPKMHLFVAAKQKRPLSVITPCYDSSSFSSIHQHVPFNILRTKKAIDQHILSKKANQYKQDYVVLHTQILNL